jgi:hypothetical protein
MDCGVLAFRRRKLRRLLSGFSRLSLDWLMSSRIVCLIFTISIVTYVHGVVDSNEFMALIGACVNGGCLGFIGSKLDDI